MAVATRARLRLEAELDNLRRASSRAVPTGSPHTLPLARILARILARALMARGAFEETATLLEAALSAPGEAQTHDRRPDPRSEGALADTPPLLLLLGERRQTQGLDGLAELERARASAEACAARDIEALAQVQLGLGFASRSELDRALTLLHSTCDTTLAAGHRAIEGRVPPALGEVCWRAGRVNEAEPQLTLAHTIRSGADARRSRPPTFEARSAARGRRRPRRGRAPLRLARRRPRARSGPPEPRRGAARPRRG